MMLHEARHKAGIEQRVRALGAGSVRRWGKMSVGQMLWHVNEAMEGALGRIAVPPQAVPLPRPILKFIVLNMPWPKGAPTVKRWLPQNDSYDFSRERERCLRLIDEIAARPLDEPWPDSPTLGRMKGRQVSRLQAKHLNHHLTQFGV
jgi:hypothetical protein